MCSQLPQAQILLGSVGGVPVCGRSTIHRSSEARTGRRLGQAWRLQRGRRQGGRPARSGCSGAALDRANQLSRVDQVSQSRWRLEECSHRGDLSGGGLIDEARQVRHAEQHSATDAPLGRAGFSATSLLLPARGEPQTVRGCGSGSLNHLLDGQQGAAHNAGEKDLFGRHAHLLVHRSWAYSGRSGRQFNP